MTVIGVAQDVKHSGLNHRSIPRLRSVSTIRRGLETMDDASHPNTGASAELIEDVKKQFGAWTARFL